MGNYKRSKYVYTSQDGCVFVLEKVLAKGTRCGQDHCNYVFGRLLWASWPVFATHMVAN
jgi:hypothetical protein